MGSEKVLQFLGFVATAAAVAAYIAYLRTSHATQGGRPGRNPCVAAATIQVPLMTMLGLSSLDDDLDRRRGLPETANG